MPQSDRGLNCAEAPPPGGRHQLRARVGTVQAAMATLIVRERTQVWLVSDLKLKIAFLRRQSGTVFGSRRLAGEMPE